MRPRSFPCRDRRRRRARRGGRPDDGVLVGLDGGEHVPHPVRAAAAQLGDERGLVVQSGAPLQSVGGEHLVPVVADPPRVQRYLRRLTRPIGWAWVAAKNGSAAGERQSISRRRPVLSVRPIRPMYRGSGLSASTMWPRHRSRPKRRRARRRAVSRWTSASRSIACRPMPPGDLSAASRRSDSSAIVCSRVSAIAAKCRSSSAISNGSALAERLSGRSNALVVRKFMSAAPIRVRVRRVRRRTHVRPRVERPRRQYAASHRHNVTARPMIRQKQMHFVNLPFPQVPASVCDCAARTGPCRKPPGALYVESGEGCVPISAPTRPGGRQTLARRQRTPGMRERRARIIEARITRRDTPDAARCMGIASVTA